MDPSLVQAVTVLGAAGVALWVIRLLVSNPPSLHTHSEVEGLRADKAILSDANLALRKALTDVNKDLGEILKLLQNGSGGAKRDGG